MGLAKNQLEYYVNFQIKKNLFQNQARGFAEAGEIINIDDDEEQLYRKLLFKHKMDILKSRC